MNIFVGNISHQTTEIKLRTLFEVYGRVNSVKIVTDAFSSHSRGFGFVDMQDRTEGKKAVEQLNNTSVDAQSLVVNEARPKNNERRDGFSSRKTFDNRY